MSWEKRKLHINDSWFCRICNSYNKVYDKKLRVVIKECKECKASIHPNIEINKNEA
jgi:uncharacterized protein YdcH (DUF465 family)